MIKHDNIRHFIPRADRVMWPNVRAHKLGGKGIQNLYIHTRRLHFLKEEVIRNIK